MSFFADLLMGGVGGVANGMQMQDKVDREEVARQDALKEKRDLALQLQQQRSEDLRYRVDQDARNKIDALALRETLANGGGGGGGSGSGGNGGSAGATNVMERMIMGAKTPEEQAMAVRYVKARAGEDAAATVAEYYGKPMQETVDTNAQHRIPANQAGPQPEVNLAQRDVKGTDAGTKALNELLAMANPANYKSFVEGSRGSELLKSGGKAAATGANPVESAELLQRYSDPAARQQVAETRAGATVDAATIRANAPRASGGGAEAAQVKGDSAALTRARSDLQKAISSKPGVLPADIKARDQAIANAKALVAKLEGGAAPAPATKNKPSTSNW